jgi:hypothetical protein
MSLYNQTVSNTPLSLDGLINGSFNDITINGFPFDPKNVVPYTGALKSVDLNTKQLTNASLVSASSMITNTMRITTVPSGTVAKSLAVDASGNVIEGSTIPTQINVTAIALGYSSPLYFTYIVTNSAGDRVLYVDTNAPMTYNTNSKTLSLKNLYADVGSTWNNYGTTFSQTSNCGSLSVTSLATLPQFTNFSATPPVGVPAYFLGVDSGNQLITTAGISAQPTITAINTNATYYLTFAPNSTTTASSPLYVDAGASLTYNAFTNTLTVPIADIPTSLTANGSFTANGSNSIAGYAPLASPALTGTPTAPTATAGTNTTQIATTQFVTTAVSGISQPTVTGIQTNANYYMMFAPNATTTANSALYVDSGTDFKYNPSTNTLYLYKLILNELGSDTLFTGAPTTTTPPTASSSARIANCQYVMFTLASYAPLASPIFTGTPNAPTQSVGNNSTAIATTAFVQSAIPAVAGVYLPLAGGTMTGTIGISASNLGFLLMDNSKTVSYDYTIGSNGTSGANTWMTLRSPASMAGIAPLVTITSPTLCSSTLTVTSTLIANSGVSINSGGLNYANIGFSGQSTFSGDLTIFARGGTPVFYISENGINAQILATSIYQWYIGGSPVMNISSQRIGHQMGSMFDFSVAGNWDNSNSLFVTTGGISGNNAGVGMGFNTTLDSGLLCSIAPNVAWKRMTYKANDHLFQIAGNTSMVTISGSGLLFGGTGTGIIHTDSTSYGSFACSGGKNGWRGMSISNGSKYFMGNDSAIGIYVQAYNWVIREDAGTCYFDLTNYRFNTLPDQTYNPDYCIIGNRINNAQWGQQFSFVYANGGVAWGGGLTLGSIYKASTQSYLRTSGSISYYQSGVGMCYMIVRYYNTSTGSYYDYGNNWFSNVAYNHNPVPVMVQSGQLPGGYTYQITIYNTGSCITDGNDTVFLLNQVTWA